MHRHCSIFQDRVQVSGLTLRCGNIYLILCAGYYQMFLFMGPLPSPLLTCMAVSPWTREFNDEREDEA